MNDVAIVAAERRAHDLLVFCAGLEDRGLASTSRRSREAARDVLSLAGELRVEREARRRMQAERDRALALLADRAGRAAREAVS